jgi:hypothetical protein
VPTPDLRMEQYGNLRNILTEMHELLRKHDAGQQQYPLAVVRAIDSGDGEAVTNLLNSLEFWGGAGSIDDLILFEIPWTPEFRIDKDDNERLRVLLHLVGREMVALNIKHVSFRAPDFTN